MTLPETLRKSNSPEYTLWKKIKARCAGYEERNYKYYTLKGIKVCERWLNSFDNFVADMGERPSAKHSLDRINNDGDYAPENCRWATDSQQNQNVGLRNSNKTGFRGVRERYKNKYQVEVGYDKQKVWVGVFDDPEEAASAYDSVVIQLFGEHAATNFGGAQR